MVYVYRCPDCGNQTEIMHSMNDDTLRSCEACFETMHKVPQVPQIVTQPFHLQEFNRFKGDGTDYLAYRRKYDRMWDTKEDRQKETATIDAQMAGAEVMKVKPTKSLAETIHEHGVPVRG